MLKTFSIRSNEVLNSECLRSVVLSSVQGLLGGPWRLSVGLFKKVAVVVGSCKEDGTIVKYIHKKQTTSSHRRKL